MGKEILVSFDREKKVIRGKNIGFIFPQSILDLQARLKRGQKWQKKKFLNFGNFLLFSYVTRRADYE